MEGTNSEDAISRTTLNIDWNRLEEAFAQIGIDSKIPEGAFTVEEYAHQFDMSAPGARHRLNLLIKEGVLGKANVKLDGRNRCFYFFLEEAI